MSGHDEKFDLFEIRRHPRRLRPDEVSLSNTNMTLSEELAASHLEGVKTVLLLFNASDRLIGIKPAAPEERGYKLSGRSVPSLSFCRHFKIRERGRFRARFANGMLLVDLRLPSSS